MIWDWKITGRTASPDNFIRPWLDYPINVIGYELLLQRGRFHWWQRLFDRSDWWFAIGSTIQPDAMIWLGPGELRVARFWPAGTSQPWPSKETAKPVHVLMRDGKPYAASGDLIDVHGICYGGGQVILLLTIYYTAEGGL